MNGIASGQLLISAVLVGLRSIAPFRLCSIVSFSPPNWYEWKNRVCSHSARTPPAGIPHAKALVAATVKDGAATRVTARERSARHTDNVFPLILMSPKVRKGSMLFCAGPPIPAIVLTAGLASMVQVRTRRNGIAPQVSRLLSQELKEPQRF